MDETDFSTKHSSIYIAPLRIEKAPKPKRTSSNASRKSRPRSQPHSRNQSVSTHSRTSSHQQITPPPTPNTSQDSLAQSAGKEPTPPFQPFLRAFYEFHPNFSADSSTVTLPLNLGDVILVHSVHTNGWADGTMLSSGARGWLPTNYCDEFNPEQLRPLLKACTVLFDQFRGGSAGGLRASQVAVTSVVAGVRHLLETTECLTREASNVKSNDGIRRTRKVLLTELSTLVKTAKRLPGHSEYSLAKTATEDVTDEMILRCFKIVVRGVRFLDIWNQRHNLQNDFIAEEAGGAQGEDADDHIPPTPPADSTAHSMGSTGSVRGDQTPEGNTEGHDYRSRSSSVSHHRGSQRGSPPQPQGSHPLPSTPYSQTPRAGSPSSPDKESFGSQLQPAYALARLNVTHDVLLSYLGSYIGRLYHEPRFTPQLQLTQQESVKAARELLAIVEAVEARDPQAAALVFAKEAMYARISTLISAAREAVSGCGRLEEVDEEEGIMIPDGGKKLADAATGCVRGAGECVAKSKFVIEKIGDFELHLGPFDIGLGITTPEGKLIDDAIGLSAAAKAELERQLMPPPPTPEKIPPRPPPKEDPLDEKPLPTLPFSELEVERLTMDTTMAESNVASSAAAPCSPDAASPRRSSSASVIAPLPQLAPSSTQDENAGGAAQKRDMDAKTSLQKSIRADSIGAASITTADYTIASSVRGSELSMTSTRATTPEPASSTSISTPLLTLDLTMMGSQLSLESGSGSEILVPEKLVPEDLTFNKGGQITGGTLPALVERLTVHDSTPDAVFVATFYLTFRLFTTPKEFAQSLVDRFDSVGDGPAGAAPVRLRVYNVFKGWLESHWRKTIDDEALETITSFAGSKLKAILPAAGKRLEELTEKVSSTDGLLVPRLVSGIGKATTATTQYTLPETPIPTPAVTRNQLSLLRSALTGGPNPTVLDFDPSELARQLTLKESKMFCSILPEELLAQEWTKKRGSLATNVLAMSSLSTDLANLVAETILDATDPKRRAVLIKHWIKVADRCLELNNYDSLMAIMCTLNTSTIGRLKRTWELVSYKTKLVLDHLRAVIDVSKNHAVLRARLRGHVPPCLPFLGTYLTDLTFIDVGNPSKRPVSEGSAKQLINFDKHVKTARIISELQRFQIPYRIAEVSEMQEWIDAQIDRVHNSKTADVQHLYRRSLLLEPRETQPRAAPVELSTPAAPVAPKESQKIDLFSWAHAFKVPTSTT
ncbi:ras guanine nucleotide exchange factor domain-containing protein [Tuber borchii]|uniref:Ras guanine nucleotide exchange factor domain-containing protein n=1 Tax=Tuber borchii TaxID=42251 RepID=A0A2T6ZEX1_TUBBO|nr:ras guanine nucleotide exchange factor domain-containing protein [Tuber borchii]